MMEITEKYLKDLTECAEGLLRALLPNAHIEVFDDSFMGLYGAGIIIAASDHEIGGLKRDYPAMVSLALNERHLEPRNYGGNTGGQVLGVKPTPTELRLGIVNTEVEVPFKRVETQSGEVLSTLRGFALRWAETVREQYYRGRMYPYPGTDHLKATTSPEGSYPIILDEVGKV